MNSIERKIIFSTTYIINQLENNNDEISLNIFISEILKRSNTTFNILTLSNIYLSRFIKTLNNENYNWRKIFTGTLILAHKYLCDIGYNRNILWVHITGLKINEINEIEKLILNKINFDLYVSCEFFNNVKTILTN